LSFELRRSLRSLKPQRALRPYAARSDLDLPFVTAEMDAGPELLLDTTVYIDVMQGRLPAAVERLLKLRISNHSSIALAELTHLFGRLDPAHPGTKRALDELADVVAEIPPHRLTVPGVGVFGEAGMLAGLAARVTSAADGADLLNDALLLLHARETGCALLSRNVRDFDRLQQLTPQANVLLYRRP
jgi:predicted nucleic acid-binding protein